MALSLSEADRIRPAKLKITSSYSKREVKEGKFPPEFVAFLEVLVTCFGSNLLIRSGSSERAAAFGASRPASFSEAMTGFHQVSAIPVRGETIGIRVCNGLAIVEITHTQADAGEHGDDGETRGARAPMQLPPALGSDGSILDRLWITAAPVRGGACLGIFACARPDAQGRSR